MAPHRERVEQRLRRVLVGAVAGVDHARPRPAGVGQQVRRPRRPVAYDDRVGAHRLQGQRGVLEALALGQRRALGGEVDDVGREPLGGRLERDPGAGAVLEEQVHDRAAAQRGQLLDRPVGQRPELLGGLQDQLGVRAGQVPGAQQVAVHRASSSSVERSVEPVGRARRAPGDGHGVERRRTPRAAPRPSRPARSAGSCRRSRRGSAARGGRGRPAPRAGPPRGRPTSVIASSAARMVRPENSTSSTSTTTLPSMPPCGISVGSSVRAGRSRRSSRYIVTSSDPTGTSTPSTAAILAAIRWASGTPREGMPSSTRSPAPLLRSRISCAMRVSAREMSPGSRTVRPGGRHRAGLGGHGRHEALQPPSPPHGTAR